VEVDRQGPGRDQKLVEPWYRVVQPRPEVREGRSFNPDEFAIALEQVVAGTAPQDYTSLADFFARTCFTRALSEHTGMVARRLVGETVNAAPVLTLITQFGGGKTHTLTALYHSVRNHNYAIAIGAGLRGKLGVQKLPDSTQVAVFVGNATQAIRARRPGSMLPDNSPAMPEWPR